MGYRRRDNAVRTSVGVLALLVVASTGPGRAEPEALDDPLVRLEKLAASMDTRRLVDVFQETLDAERDASRSMVGIARRLEREARDRQAFEASAIAGNALRMGRQGTAKRRLIGGYGDTVANSLDMLALFLDHVDFNQPVDVQRQSERLEGRFQQVLQAVQDEQMALSGIAALTYDRFADVRWGFAQLDLSGLDAFYASTEARAGLCAMAVDVGRADASAGLSEAAEVIIANRRTLDPTTNAGLEHCVRRNVELPPSQFARLLAGLTEVKDQQRQQLTRLGAEFTRHMRETDGVLHEAGRELVRVEETHERVQLELRAALAAYHAIAGRIGLDIAKSSAVAGLQIANIIASEGRSGVQNFANAARGAHVAGQLAEVIGDLSAFDRLRALVEEHEEDIVSAMEHNTTLVAGLTRDLRRLRTDVDQRWRETTLAVRAFVGEKQAAQMQWVLPD